MNLNFEELEQVEEYGNGADFLKGIFSGITAASIIIGLFFT